LSFRSFFFLVAFPPATIHASQIWLASSVFSFVVWHSLLLTYGLELFFSIFWCIFPPPQLHLLLVLTDRRFAGLLRSLIAWSYGDLGPGQLPPCQRFATLFTNTLSLHSRDPSCPSKDPVSPICSLCPSLFPSPDPMFPCPIPLAPWRRVFPSCRGFVTKDFFLVRGPRVGFPARL